MDTHDYSLIFRLNDNQVEMLVLDTEDGVSIPITINPPHFWQTCQPVNEPVQEHMGFELLH